MSLSRLSWPLEAPHKWAAAALLVALAFALRAWLADVTGPSVPFLFAFPAVFAAAWLGGLGPGLFATGLCVVGYAALAWLGRMELEGLLLRGALFTVSAAIMCVMAEQLGRKVGLRAAATGDRGTDSRTRRASGPICGEQDPQPDALRRGALLRVVRLSRCESTRC